MMLQAVLAVLLHFGAPAGQVPVVADAIVKYARTPDEAAFMSAWAKSESHFLERISAGHCERWECDAHRINGEVVHLAVGLWQTHRGAAGKDWAELPGNIDAQARVAARMTRWAMRQCPHDAVRGGFRVLGGLGCDRELKGEETRVADFEAARRMLP